VKEYVNKIVLFVENAIKVKQLQLEESTCKKVYEIPGLKF
jgi:hypothetical protein